jgi:hypothetical protein
MGRGRGKQNNNICKLKKGEAYKHVNLDALNDAMMTDDFMATDKADDNVEFIPAHLRNIAP